MFKFNQASKGISLINSLLAAKAGTLPAGVIVTIGNNRETAITDLSATLDELKTVANLPESSITLTEEVMSLCNKLITMQGINPDVEGDPKVLAAAKIEQNKQEE
jgi:hypothetical protein